VVSQPARRNVDFYCAIVIVGLLAGAAGLAATVVLRFVEHLTYHYAFGTLLEGITGSSPVRRALGPMVGGALAALGWWILRRRTEVPPLEATTPTIAGYRGCRGASTLCCRCCWSAPAHPWDGKGLHANSRQH
jgi:hypothetical protein